MYIKLLLEAVFWSSYYCDEHQIIFTSLEQHWDEFR